MQGAVEKANEILQSIPNAVIAGQFENPANPMAHYQTTAPELYAAMDGDVDVFVAGVGTGGTITGVGRYLKEKNAAVKIVAVEPAASPLLSKGVSGKHGLQGIGANFVPKILDTGIYDEVLTVTDEEAFATARLLCEWEGVFVGISAGAAVAACIALAKRPENRGKKIATVLPDSGDRYLSTGLFQ